MAENKIRPTNPTVATSKVAEAEDTKINTRRGLAATLVLAMLLAITALTTALAPSSWAAAGGSSLQPGETLYNGQSLVNGGLTMAMQSDGNFVLYIGTRALWQSGTSGRGGARVSMQGDGNLVVYNTANQWLWQSGTGGHSGSRLVLQSDANAVVYNTANQWLWQSGTAGKAATTRPSGFCVSQPLALIGASVYTVCMSAIDSFNGNAASGSGYVYSQSCNVDLPTGVGWACSSSRHGSYWNSSLNAWEDWLNFKLVYISPLLPFGYYTAHCMYLRVDTNPDGHTDHRSFVDKFLSTSATC